MRLADQLDMDLSAGKPSSAVIDARELTLSSRVPYTWHYDDATVMTKDNALVQVIKLDGLLYESLSDDQIKQFERLRNTVLRQIANSDRSVYVHLIRRKTHVYPAGEYRNWFARQLNEAWHERSERKQHYVNDLYLTIVRHPFRHGAPGVLDSWFSKLTGKVVDPNDLDAFAEPARELYEASRFVVRALEQYRPRLLGLTEKDGQSFSEPARFLNYLINLDDAPVPLETQSLDRLLSTTWHHFGRDAFEVQGLTHRRTGTAVSMLEWPSHTKASRMDEFLKLPVEFIMTQSFRFIDRISAEQELATERRRLIANNSLASDQIEGIEESLRDLGAGRTVNGLHHLTIIPHVPTQGGQGGAEATHSALNTAIEHIRNAFISLGVTAVRERFGMEIFYWSQLPGQSQSLIGRRGKITSANFAGFAALHNHATGKLDGNQWGPALTALETEAGSAYYLNLHREIAGLVAGHFAVTAETGAGKTALVASIVAFADKVEPRVFWFDQNHGSEIFMRAMGGKHTVLTTQRATGWNPFQLPDSPDNRALLVDLQVLMRTCYGQEVTDEDMAKFNRVVELNYDDYKLEDRRLRNLAWVYTKGSDLDKAMSLWHSDGANAALFDNATDSIDLTAHRHYCFEMKELMKGGMPRPELPVVMAYLFHRIDLAMDGHPFLMIIDEVQHLIESSPLWRRKLGTYLEQIRRKDGVIGFMTPDAKYLYTPVEAMRKQVVTRFMLPTANALEKDYVTELGFTKEEFEFIRDTPVSSRKFLLRRGQDSVRVVFDLSDLSDFIPVLSSSDRSIKLMHAVMQELGSEDPETWVPVFMERAKQERTHNLSS